MRSAGRSLLASLQMIAVFLLAAGLPAKLAPHLSLTSFTPPQSYCYAP
jgi:hypothetical protein